MSKELISLGIESSAHTFGIGIADNSGNILSNEKSVYKPPLGKGIIPIDAANFHKLNCDNVLKNALDKSNLKMEDIDMIAYVAGAGMPPCLFVGANFAEELAKKYKKPLIPVCHQIAHLEIGKLTTQTKDLVFLYLSGGNTQVISFVEGRYRVFGETEDIPVGNCLDIVARKMNLPMPGGVEIEKLAKNGKYVELPYVVKGMDLSFSGIATAAVDMVEKNVSKKDIAYSLQETCFAMLTEVTERAVAHTGKEEVLLIGGVAANKRMQEMIKIMTEERNAKFFVVDEEYSGDQGAMIAWTGLLSYQYRKIPKIKDKILPRLRIDQISWFQTTDKEKSKIR